MRDLFMSNDGGRIITSWLVGVPWTKEWNWWRRSRNFVTAIRFEECEVMPRGKRDGVADPGVQLTFMKGVRRNKIYSRGSCGFQIAKRDIPLLIKTLGELYERSEADGKVEVPEV